MFPSFEEFRLNGLGRTAAASAAGQLQQNSSAAATAAAADTAAMHQLLLYLVNQYLKFNISWFNQLVLVSPTHLLLDFQVRRGPFP